jgi:hypothetical protein
MKNSGLYEYSTMSPGYKPRTIELYKQIVMSLPVAVSSFDNDTFWKRVLDIMRGITKVGSAIPGKYGVALGGMSTLLDAINDIAY